MRRDQAPGGFCRVLPARSATMPAVEQLGLTVDATCVTGECSSGAAPRLWTRHAGRQSVCGIASYREPAQQRTPHQAARRQTWPRRRNGDRLMANPCRRPAHQHAENAAGQQLLWQRDADGCRDRRRVRVGRIEEGGSARLLRERSATLAAQRRPNRALSRAVRQRRRQLGLRGRTAPRV